MRKIPRQGVTSSHNPKYSKQEQMTLTKNQNDSTSENICALLEI
jgi:hypothetical protein